MRWHVAAWGLIGVLWLGGSVQAASGGAVTVLYELDQLADRPGAIVASPDYLAVLQFDSEVERIASARADLLNVEVSGNQVLVRAAQRSGATDLVVNVGGHVALFTVSIDAQAKGPRRYVVRSAPTERPALPAPSSVSPESGAARAADPKPTEVTSRAVFSVPAAGEATAPAWLIWRVMPTVRPDGKRVFFYELANRGEHPVVPDVSSLRLRSGSRLFGGADVLRTGVATAGRWFGTLEPGESQYGVIVFQEPVEGPVELSWQVRDLVGRETITLRWSEPSEAVPQAGGVSNAAPAAR